jgi:hypothetical protein
MMKVLWILFIGLFVFLIPASGQHLETHLSPGVEKAREAFHYVKNERPYLRGWRIVIAITRDRRELDRLEREFRRSFSGMNSDWVFQDPFFRILTGTYFDRWDCLYDLTLIRQEFPGAFEMNTNIPYETFAQHLKRSLKDE